MPRIPVIKARQVVKVLKKKGFLHQHTQGSHFIFYHPEKKTIVSVPVHKGRDLGRGITLAILEDAKISIDEFLKLL